MNVGDKVRIENVPYLRDATGVVSLTFDDTEHVEVAVDGREGFYAVAVENLVLINKEEN